MSLSFFAAMTEGAYLFRMVNTLLEHVNLPFDPIQNMLVSAIGLSDNALQVCRETAGEKRTIMFDSGSFYVEINRMKYEEMLTTCFNTYMKHRWADIYVLPDHIARTTESDESVEAKVQDTIKYSVQTFQKLPDDIKPKCIPVVHGRYKDQIDRCLEAYINLGVQRIGFGAYQTKKRDSKANNHLLTNDTIAFIEYVSNICKQHGLKLHLFGVGSAAYSILFKALNITSFDSTNWSMASGYGSVFFPFTRSYSITPRKAIAFANKREWKDSVLTKEQFYRVKELTQHSCPFCESYEGLVENRTNRMMHNLISIAESVYRVDTTPLDVLDNIYQQGSPKYRNLVKKWFLASDEEREKDRRQRQKIVEQAVAEPKTDKAFKQLSLTFGAK